MTHKQKTAAILGIACMVVAFAFIYQQFASQRRSVNSTTVPTSTTMKPPTPKQQGDTMMKKGVPTTPGNAADKIIESTSADDSALDREANAEADSALKSINTIDDVTNTYDTTQN